MGCKSSNSQFNYTTLQGIEGLQVLNYLGDYQAIETTRYWLPQEGLSYTGESSTTASSDAGSDFSSRRILFSDVCFSRLSLSVALCFDEGDDNSVIDSATDDGEGGGSSESLG